jgi:MFS family permease
MLALFSKNRITAPPGYNRWKVPLASVSIHLCIGSVYAWSIFNPPLTRALGVAGSAADDWTLNQVVWIFTVAIVFLGLSAAVAGRWLERVGPRLVGTVSACCWGGGFLLGGLGIVTHQLWLLYLGYGVVGGCGLGLGYVSPVSTLIKWFPDRRGMAAGMAIMGFGGGAIIGSPLKEHLIHTFYEAPVYLGKQEEVPLITEGGKRYADVNGQRKEVIVVAETERDRMIVRGEAGVYVVGTGKSGVAQTFFALGIIYFAIMVIAAFSYRLPAPGWKPTGWTPPSEEETRRKMVSTHNVGVNEALKTRQFYLLWIVLCLNVSAGIGILAVGKDMMLDLFGTSMVALVTAGFATTFVQMMSVANMGGRFAWAIASDYLGRQRTYLIFFTLGMLLYASIPLIARQSTMLPPFVWLVLFYAVVLVIMTMYGGGFATIPAYLADLFGSKFVGGIHGRLLTAWSTAGVVGPLALAKLRESSRRAAIEDLAGKVDPEAFRQQFGAGVDQLPALIEAKTVTIAKLMSIAPAGTPDPTVTLYNSTMYLMVALLAVAFVANWLVRPVKAEHHLKEGDAP